MQVQQKQTRVRSLLPIAGIIAALTIIIPVTALAGPDLSYEGSGSQSTGRDGQISIKQSDENRDESGNRESSTTTTGGEFSDSKAARAARSMQNSARADVELDLTALFATAAAKRYPCVQRSLYPADIGLTAVVGGSGMHAVVDENRRAYLADQGRQNAPLRGLIGDRHYQTFIDHAQCLVRAGAWYATNFDAYPTTAQRIGFDLAQNQMESKMQGLIAGRSDARMIAQAIIADNRQPTLDIAETRDIAIQEIANNECRTTAELLTGGAKLWCGSVAIDLEAQTVLYQNILLYGQGAMYGYTAKIGVSSSYDTSKVLEIARDSREYKSWAEAVEEHVAQLQSQGRHREAAMTRKKAADIVASGKATISIGSLIPQIPGK